MNNILVIRNDRFGEFLLIIPALRALKERFPQAKITLAVDNPVVELTGYIEYVDDVMIWENREHSFKETLEFSRQIKMRNFDMAVIFNPSQASHLAVQLAKVPVRVGYDRKMGYLLTDKMKDVKDLGLKHEVESNLELVSLVGAATDNKKLSLSIGEGGFLEGLKGSCVVAVHPWTSDPIKQWPLQKFRDLIKRLAGLDIVVVGGKDEAIKNEDFFSHIHEIVINLAGKTSLVELARVLKEANLLISGDSGPMHLAAAVGTPVLALFRNDLPGKTAKRWGPWGEGHRVIEKNTLGEISVDEVVKTVKDMLTKDKERVQ